MRRAIVQTETGGETDSCLESVLLYQSTHGILDAICDLGHRQPRAYELACVISNKPMYFSTTPDILICYIWILYGQFLEIPFLLRGRTPRVTDMELSFRSR
jgi:hypothetical protein